MSEVLIDVAGIKKIYGKVTALNNVSFTVYEGEIIGYLGPNGSGKTTTISVITGLCTPNEGSVKVHGNDLIKNGENVDAKIAVVLENHGIYPELTAWENLEFFARFINVTSDKRKELIEKSLILAGLINRKNSLAKTFSKGMLQKLAIVRAMILDPQILVLDEPFDGVDVESRFSIIKILKQWIKDGKRCIFLTSHNMADVEDMCTRIIIIRSGDIIWDGSMNDLHENRNTQTFEIKFSQVHSESVIRKMLRKVTKVVSLDCDGINLTVEVEKGIKSSTIASVLGEGGLVVEEIHMKRNSLAEEYLRMVKL